MLTRPCSLLESIRMPAAPSATRNFSSSGRKARIRMNSANSLPHVAVEVRPGLLGRRLDRDLGEQDPGPLELPLVRGELVGRLGLDVDHRPALGAFGRGAPAGRLEQDPLLDRHDHAALGLAASPGPVDRPGLEVRVRQAVLLELVAASTGWPWSGSASRSAAARSCRRGTRCWPSAPSACRSRPESPGSPP